MIISVCSVGDSWTYASFSYAYKMFGIATSAPKGQTTGIRTGLAYYPSAGVIYKNYALSGQRLTDLQSGVSQLDGLIPAGYSATGGRPQRKFVLTVLIGINVSDSNATTFAASVGAYCQARKTAGWDYILLGTLPSRGDGITANFDTYKNNYNNIIKGAGWAAANGVDAIVDCTSIAEISSDGAYDNATYASYWNADNVHLTDAGNELWKVPWQTAIEAAITELS